MKRIPKKVKKHNFLAIKNKLDSLHHHSAMLTEDERLEYFELSKILDAHRLKYLYFKFLISIVSILLCIFWIDLQKNSTLILNYRGNEIFLISESIKLQSYDLSVILNIFFILFMIFILYFISENLENIFTIKFIKKINHDNKMKNFTILKYCKNVIPKDISELDWRHRFED